ncbi:MAG: hypothetical protein NZ766_00615 [SAR86 cluster bacterium]|nr:hypothetical protein [SAR86 cluster bacterium]
MSDGYFGWDDDNDSEVFVKRNGILQKVSGKEKKRVIADLKKKKGIQKNRKWIEDNNDERDNYEVIDHTKLSPEQERNKPEHIWQKPRRD